MRSINTLCNIYKEDAILLLLLIVFCVQRIIHDDKDSYLCLCSLQLQIAIIAVIYLLLLYVLASTKEAKRGGKTHQGNINNLCLSCSY